MHTARDRLTLSLVFILLSPAATLMALAGCQGPPSSAPSSTTAAAIPAQTPPVQAAYIGDAACASCHRHEFDAHRHSSHALTMRKMDRASLGALAPPFGRVKGTDVILSPLGPGYQIMAAGQEDERAPLALALGSGKTGMTFVGYLDSQTMLEVRASYFPPRKQWYITPGHETQPPENVGVLYLPPTARKCMLCHAVAMPPDSLEPEPRFFGVGCEACHGPGSAHVEAAKAHATGDLKIDRLADWTASRLNEEVCGKCHRTEQSVAQQGRGADMTHRFQPYGLMKSRCFLESRRALSCLTCHDPHTDASRDTAMYESKCLACHSPSSAASTAASKDAGRPCPVNPKSGCIPCHMPKRPVFPATKLPLRMADHYIRIHKDLRAAALQ